MAERVLVTGGAGFVGSHLVEQLAAAGARVSVIDDLSRGRREWLPPGADLFEIDLRDAPAVGEAVAAVAPDIVVHLAALHFIPAVDDAPELAHDLNVRATESLLEALGERPPARLVFASTAAVYPDRAGAIDESCAPAPLDLYGRTKLEGERLVSAFGERHGTQVVAARIFNVVGRRETNPHVVPEVIRQLRAGSRTVRLGNVSTRRDYTDVRDTSDALRRLAALEASAGFAVFNVGSGRSTSVQEVVELCADILGTTVTIEPEEARRRSRDRAELVANGRRLREATGWRPRRTLRETLADLLAAPETD